MSSVSGLSHCKLISRYSHRRQLSVKFVRVALISNGRERPPKSRERERY